MSRITPENSRRADIGGRLKRARSRHPVLHFRESVWTYPAGLKYLAPKFLLYSEKSTELFGRSTDDRSERFCLEFRANLRVRKDLIHHTVELLNYGDRSSGWRHDSEPRSVFESSTSSTRRPLYLPNGMILGSLLSV